MVFNRGISRLLSIILLIAGMFSHNQLEFLFDIAMIAYAVGGLSERRTATFGRVAIPATMTFTPQRPRVVN
jgi:hypothetical protein